MGKSEPEEIWLEISGIERMIRDPTPSLEESNGKVREKIAQKIDLIDEEKGAKLRQKGKPCQGRVDLI